MAQEAKVRIRLDTRQAKQDLKGITREGRATSGRVADSLRAGGSAIGGLARGLGIGAGIGAGIGIARRIVADPISEVLGEATAGIRADFDALLGAPEARGKKAAREIAKQNLAELYQREGISRKQLDSYYQQQLRMTMPREIGRTEIDRALGGGRKEGDEEAADKAVNRIIEAINNGFQKIIDAVGAVSGK